MIQSATGPSEINATARPQIALVINKPHVNRISSSDEGKTSLWGAVVTRR